MGEREQAHNRFDKCENCGGYILQNQERPSACRCVEPKRVNAKSKNHHPTVKPLALMEYLVRLITPPKGLVLDPFAGTGTTCGACIKQGFQFIACEKEAEYVAIAEKRIERWRAQGVLDFDQTTIKKANCA